MATGPVYGETQGQTSERQVNDHWAEAELEPIVIPGQPRLLISDRHRSLRNPRSKHLHVRVLQAGIDDRGSVHPSGDQIEVVTETRRSSKETSPGI